MVNIKIVKIQNVFSKSKYDWSAMSNWTNIGQQLIIIQIRMRQSVSTGFTIFCDIGIVTNFMEFVQKCCHHSL